MRDVFLLLTGFTIGIACFFLLVTHLNEVSDIINTIAIFVNIGIGVALAYFVPNKLTNNRYAKEYHIKLLIDASSEYEIFLKDIRNSKLNRNEITREFKYFSMKFISLDATLNLFISNNSGNLQIVNRGIHQVITGSLEFNTAVTNGKVRLNFGTSDRMNTKHNEFITLITKQVIKINSK